MKPTPDNILKTLTVKIKKALWILGLHAFSLILFLVLVDIILGGFIFYKYVFLTEKEEPKVTENIFKFDTKTYQDVLKELQTRGQGDEGSSMAQQPGLSK